MVGGEGGDPLRAAWTTTFVDLTALLLAFFVMVFAMSTMDEASWSTLSSALVEGRQAGEVTPPPPALRPLSAPAEARARATRADYLQALLRQRLEEAAVLVPYELERDGRGLRLRVDAGLLLAGDDLRPTAQGRLILARLAELLDPLDNALLLRVRAGQAPSADGLGEARALVRALREAGYRRALGVQLPAPAEGVPPSVEILIREDAREP